MKKLNQKAFSDLISEYSLKELSFCIVHIFLRILEFGNSLEDISYLKDWCVKSINSSVRFYKKQQKRQGKNNGNLINERIKE
jgi:hypothetical protein